MVEATAREDNGSLITFNCLGDPAYTQYISFVGYEAPTLVDLILNDIANWKLPDWLKILLIILGVILLLIVLSWIVRFIKRIIKQFKK